MKQEVIHCVICREVMDFGPKPPASVRHVCHPCADRIIAARGPRGHAPVIKYSVRHKTDTDVSYRIDFDSYPDALAHARRIASDPGNTHGIEIWRALETIQYTIGVGQ